MAHLLIVNVTVVGSNHVQGNELFLFACFDYYECTNLVITEVSVSQKYKLQLRVWSV